MRAKSEQADDIDYAIGDRVNTLMRRANFTREGFGSIFGISGSAMSLKLAGKRTWAAWEVRRAADTLAVAVAVLYGDEPMPEPTRPARVIDMSTKQKAPNSRANGYKPGHSADILPFKAHAA